MKWRSKSSYTRPQPSHAWAARKPFTYVDINAVRTFILSATGRRALEAAFILTSMNELCGYTPNRLALAELDTRWKLEPGHTYYDGIREDISIDQTLDNLCGASKVATDVGAQHYDRGDPGVPVEQRPVAMTRLRTPR